MHYRQCKCVALTSSSGSCGGGGSGNEASVVCVHSHKAIKELTDLQKLFNSIAHFAACDW